MCVDRHTLDGAIHSIARFIIRTLTYFWCYPLSPLLNSSGLHLSVVNSVLNVESMKKDAMIQERNLVLL